MYCHKCGAQNDDNAYRCMSCGEALRRPAEAAPTPPPESAPSAPPTPPPEPVPQPAAAPPAGAPAAAIPNYLVQSILVTLLCCLPLGIPAIVFAAQVNGKAQAGDIQGAIESSRKAKLWCWWSFGVGLVGSLVYLVFAVLVPIIAAGVAKANG